MAKSQRRWGYIIYTPIYLYHDIMIWCIYIYDIIYLELNGPLFWGDWPSILILFMDGGLFSRPKLTLYSPTISSWSPDSFIVGSPDSCCNLSTTRYECCFVLYSLFPRRFFCHHSAQCCVPLALLDGSWQMPSMVSELAWLISHAKGHLLNLILRYL